MSWGHFQPSTFHCSFPLEPHELCAGLWAQAAQATPARALWHQSSVAQSWWLQWPVHSAMLPSAAPRSDWYPKLTNTLSYHKLRDFRKDSSESYLGHQASRGKAAEAAYILTDVLQANTAGFLQAERRVYTNPEQAADPCNHNLPDPEPRHHSQAPLLASGGVFSKCHNVRKKCRGGATHSLSHSTLVLHPGSIPAAHTANLALSMAFSETQQTTVISSACKTETQFSLTLPHIPWEQTRERGMQYSQSSTLWQQW